MRKRAGKAVIYFLVLMLCCTVAARAASSITVAKVKTAKVGKGVLTQLVTGSGTVTAKEQYSQSLPERGQKVKKVLVKTPDHSGGGAGPDSTGYGLPGREDKRKRAER